MEGVVVRRVIPSDNSCLFNAVGYVMEHNKHKARELRQVTAAAVSGDPTKYNESFLGKSNKDYCAWILDSEKWGGAIELSILADYYGREIAAYDIQTTRCDLYGQDKNYEERVLLIYDGLHYDALAVSPFEDAPEEFDQTIFQVRNGTIGSVEQLALNLVKDAQRKQNYTDTSNFTLRCGVCQIGVLGQKEAMEHAQATGHINFQEYRCFKKTTKMAVVSPSLQLIRRWKWAPHGGLPLYQCRFFSSALSLCGSGRQANKPLPDLKPTLCEKK